MEPPPSTGAEKHVLLSKPIGSKRRRQDTPEEDAAQAEADAWLLTLAKTGFLPNVRPRIEA